jgi:hypothetical protein
MKQRRGYKLSYELCKEVALKYNTKTSLQKGDASVYGKIRTSKWYELFFHMTELQKPFGYWNKERCHEEALKYKRKVDLQKGNGTVYNTIKLNGWSNELFSHMIELIKPNGYWTKERCQEEALKYTRRVDFQKNSPAYSQAQKNGWINEVCSHMPEILKPTGYWNDKEKCKEEALKYTTRKDFVKLSSGAYNASYINGWLNEVCSHMDYIFRPNGYWTYDRCKEEALKYTTRKEFRENSHAYVVVMKNEWWDEMCNHIVETKKPHGYWTYDMCKETALRYTDRYDLEVNEGACYSFIMRNKWYELITHIIPRSSLKNRYIYAFEFPDKHVYVGLTYDLDKRKCDHLTNTKNVSPVVKHMEETGLNYIFRSVYDESFDMKIAGHMEKRALELYIEDGWTPLNKAKTGGLGGMNVIWSYERIKKDLEGVTTITEARSRLKSYVIPIIKRNGWWDELMGSLIDDTGRINWTTELALEEIKKYSTRSDVQREAPGLYKFIKKNDLLNLIPLVDREKLYLNKYTKETCKEVASKYRKRTDFRKHEYAIFEVSKRRGWLDEICGHMTKLYWTYERCKNEALKYEYRDELQKGSKGCHNSIYQNKWFDLLSHMPNRKIPNEGVYKGKYTKEMLFDIVKTCKHKSDFQDRFSGAYKVAKKLNCLNELFK